MSKEQKRLKLQMFIFTVFIIVAFGIIIINEKSSTILIPKVEEKFNNYITENYKDIENDINKSKVTYKATKYTMKVTNKTNKYHYFYIYYQDKKITDTYKKDYKEGKQVLNHSNTIIQKEINKITNSNKYKTSINKKLNSFTNEIQERIIKEDNLVNLRIYNIEKELKIDKINSDNISKLIKEEITYIENNNINPRTYKFIFTDKNDISNSLEISNITYKFINNDSYNEIINDIINDNNSKLVKNTGIEYKYLN